MKFTLYKYPNEGDLTHTYSPLMNLVDKDCKIGGFTVENFKMGDLEHPVNIECQPSYDGTVNLILNDDLNIRFNHYHFLTKKYDFKLHFCIHNS